MAPEKIQIKAMEGNRVHAMVWYFDRESSIDSVPFYLEKGTGLWLLVCIAFSSRPYAA